MWIRTKRIKRRTHADEQTLPVSPAHIHHSYEFVHRYNKYASICARATRQALKEEERVKADRRGEMALRYQQWKDGKAGEQVSLTGEKRKEWGICREEAEG